MSQQPEALRLAEIIGGTVGAELRRLQAERDELLEALEDAAHALKDEGRHYQAAAASAAIAKAKGEQA